MRTILLSLTSLTILLIPQIAFASDEEGTVTWFAGTLFGRPDNDPIAIGETQYIEISLNVYDKDNLIKNLPIEGRVEVIDPNDDIKTYPFSIDELDGDDNAITYVNFLIGDEDDDTPAPPTGHYSFDITADDNKAEHYWGGFEVVDHYDEY